MWFDINLADTSSLRHPFGVPPPSLREAIRAAHVRIVRKGILHMPYAIVAILLVGLDQLTKYLTVANIPMGADVPFIPYLLQLTYTQNTGAAFSFFNQHTWILTLISLALSIILAYYVVVKPYFVHWIGRLSLTLILAGAVGNLIDRALLGYVVDMIEPIFMNFAVFNVADICVCVGGFFACVYYLFFYDKLEGNLPEKQEDNTNDDN